MLFDLNRIKRLSQSRIPFDPPEVQNNFQNLMKETKMFFISIYVMRKNPPKMACEQQYHYRFMKFKFIANVFVCEHGLQSTRFAYKFVTN